MPEEPRVLDPVGEPYRIRLPELGAGTPEIRVHRHPAQHGLHVLGGMAVNAYFWGPGAKLWKTNPVWFTNRVEHAGLFWHFVDLVWIFLFPTLYLLLKRHLL